MRSETRPNARGVSGTAPAQTQVATTKQAIPTVTRWNLTVINICKLYEMFGFKVPVAAR
jgi:hypothetical protein